MSIGPLSGVAGLQQQQNIQKSSGKLNSAIAALASGKKSSSAGEDVATLSLASQLQSSVSGLKAASVNIAQASSLLQVADSGVGQIGDILQQLRNLAQQAGSPVLNDDNRAALSEQFEQLIGQLNSVVGGTSFNNKKLLDGGLSGDDAISINSILSVEGEDSDRLSIKNLASDNLFGGKSLSILDAVSASYALSVLDSAINDVVGVRAEIGSFLQSIDYAAANVDSAIANQEAARSELQDADFAAASTEQSQALLQQNAAIAVAAQSNRLTPALLKLVS
ncbi:MAG: flagellin [Rickettsiales bacterium]